jgi:hypothetical protein
VLGRIYRNLAPLDPAGALRHEWVNARGAIARFDRGSIEIRVLDVQECPAADLAISTAIVAVVEALTAGDWSRPEEQRDIETAALNAILEETTARAEAATIRDETYLRLLGCPRAGPISAGDLWLHLIEATRVREADHGEWKGALEAILEEGCLASRILRRLGPDPPRNRLHGLYEELSACLAEGRSLRGLG